MGPSPAAHDPSVAEDGDTSPTELGRKMREDETGCLVIADSAD